MISYGSQSISEEDIAAVVDVLKNGWLTQGDKVPEFEQALCNYIGCEYATCVSNGTAALHLACLALDITTDDIVWVPAITFVATANAARYCGAQVDFIDVESSSGNICLADLERRLIIAKQDGSLPKLVIVVDIAGCPIDMEALGVLKARFGFNVIDDASHALGAEYCNGVKVGNHEVADFTTTSFHPVKPITTAEGGAIFTNNKVFSDRIKRLRSHGIEKDSYSIGWSYDQVELGYNYRMSDLQAALGISQIKKLDSFIAQRQRIATQYNNTLELEGVSLPIGSSGAKSSWHLYVIKIGPSAKKDRDSVYEQLLKANISTQVHYIPVYKHSYYQNHLGASITLPNAEKYFRSALSLPIHCQLSDDEQSSVVHCLSRLLA